MKIILNDDPYRDKTTRGLWPVQWIWHPDLRLGETGVLAFKLNFKVSHEVTAIIHVSADNRYHLFLNGSMIGLGPERGEPRKWFYESYRLKLSPGKHILVARVWYLEPEISPFAQMSIKGGFILGGTGETQDIFSTGIAPWQVMKLNGYIWEKADKPYQAWGVGSTMLCDGRLLQWGWLNGKGTGWVEPVKIGAGIDAERVHDFSNKWLLSPSKLPACLNTKVKARKEGFRVLYVGNFNPKLTCRYPAAELSQGNMQVWQNLIDGISTLRIPKRASIEAVIDLTNYYCCYTDIVISGGRDASIKIEWAESLFENVKPDEQGLRLKGDRNQISGKIFIGDGETFISNGGRLRHFDTLWYQAGRYVRISVVTAEESLVVNELSFRETRYPLEYEGFFNSDDSGLEKILPVAVRTMQMCAHETYIDCPYYEQLMYAGDTRIQVLTTYAMTKDVRLPLKAIDFFYGSICSRRGYTQARYPAKHSQFIPPYSLWWICMVHDYFMWRDAKAVRGYLPGVRRVLQAFEKFFNLRGLLKSPPGWNFVDWYSDWSEGVPPDGTYGVSSIINLQYLLALQADAEIEEYFGEHMLACRSQLFAKRLGIAVLNAFWNEKRGLIADDLRLKSYSEHAQVLAVLCGILNQKQRRSVAKNLEKEGLSQTTIYFSHYYFEAVRILNRIDLFFKRLSLWQELLKTNCRTVIEEPEPSRSDCHGWGAHPLFHYQATILGIRPSKPGFSTVSICPKPHHLRHIEGALPHPKGMIKVLLKIDGDKIKGWIELPKGLNGMFQRQGQNMKLREGRQKIA